MIAILHVGETPYQMLQIEEVEMDRLQKDELLCYLFGFPVYFDSRERVFPRLRSGLDARVEFIK
jgi:hypothetical protein